MIASPIRIGTRGSALALWQARFVERALGELAPRQRVELVEITSTGDHIKDVPLSTVEGTGFFTAAIERALLGGRVDVAVHSFKDLPVDHAAALVVAAVPSRGPVEDVLCARNGWTLDTLPPGSRVGTCSLRRTAQVLARRPDLRIEMLRGNVPTRVNRVLSGELDAIVLARAGLVRLKLEQHISEIFAIEQMLPAPAQGALAVQCRREDTELTTLLSGLDHASTRTAVTAERAVLHALGGGCSVPVGAAAMYDGGRVSLAAAVFAVDGSRAVRTTGEGDDAAAVGGAAARQLIANGAGPLLVRGADPRASFADAASPTPVPPDFSAKAL